MSEINAIATNNFILHNIDAKKLYVQEPLFTANSGDAVYVGWRPDETVLWSGEPARLSTVTNLVESMNNFEHIDFYFCGGYLTNNDTVDRINPTSAICFLHGAGISNVWYQWAHLSANPDMDKIIFDKGKAFNFGAATSTTWSNPSVSTGIPDSFNCYKIVGINRKENA